MSLGKLLYSLENSGILSQIILARDFNINCLQFSEFSEIVSHLPHKRSLQYSSIIRNSHVWLYTVEYARKYPKSRSVNSAA